MNDPGVPNWAENFKGLFESARPTRTNDAKRSSGSADRVILQAGKTLRDQARHLEENHDLVNGILSTLVNNTVGPSGIGVEPMPMKPDGTVNRKFADELVELHEDWSRHPEVTGEHDRASMERLLARSLYRDGEVFAQHLMGPSTGLVHGTRVPYSLELLECDMVPMESGESYNANNFQGVIKNQWGRAIAYQVYHVHPGTTKAWDARIKEVPAERMIHAKLTNRIGQTRGVTSFAPVMTRLNDLKSYEEAERVAARMSACMGLYIKRGNPDIYQVGDPTEDDERIFEMAPGVIFDNLLPGEEINDVTPDRPSQLLQPFRDSMLKAVASGVNANYSTVAKDYSGTYSAQRQELTENFINYAVLQANFIRLVSVPMWQHFVATAIQRGLVTVPRSINQETIYDAYMTGPVQPWIDPAKESSANLIQVRAGFKSISQVIRERGDNPRKVFAEIQREREEIDEAGLELSSIDSTDDTNFGGNKDDSGEGKGLRDQGDKNKDKDKAEGGIVRLRRDSQ